MNDTWIKVMPENQGGGRHAGPATAKLYATGQLTLSTATYRMLGSPPRVRMEVKLMQHEINYPENPPRIRIKVNMPRRVIRLTPTTPGDMGAFSLSGGGNSPARLHSRPTVTRWPELIGDFTAHKIAGAVELRHVDDDTD